MCLGLVGLGEGKGGSDGVGEDLYFFKKKEFFEKTFINCFFSKFLRKVVWGSSQGELAKFGYRSPDEMKVEKFRFKKGLLRRALTICKGKFAQFRQIWRQKSCEAAISGHEGLTCPRAQESRSPQSASFVDNVLFVRCFRICLCYCCCVAEASSLRRRLFGARTRIRRDRARSRKRERIVLRGGRGRSREREERSR